VVEIRSKGILTESTLQEILNIKASMNMGISEKLLEEFPETVGVKLGIQQSDKRIKNPF
jgi:hypothetical protein